MVLLGKSFFYLYLLKILCSYAVSNQQVQKVSPVSLAVQMIATGMLGNNTLTLTSIQAHHNFDINTLSTAESQHWSLKVFLFEQLVKAR